MWEGNISAYTAGTIAALIAMRIMATDMATASSTALFPTIASSGNSSTAVATAPVTRTGLRPTRSDSLPHSGSATTNTRLATTPAQKASDGSMPRAAMACAGAATTQV
jgi:hypothetical protein